jgi:exosortase/archaeosortase family protein
MRYDGKLGMLVFLIAAVVLLSTSLFITPLAVSDADPSTYVIVPMLMLPLFVLFSLKAGADPDVGMRDVAIGSAMFTAFILLTLFLRFYFSFLFLSFRIDLLVLPLALAALAVLLFGTKNLRKFRGILLYALFASPPVLFLLLESYNAFTSINSVIVYGLLKPFVSGIKYVAPMTISANGYNIGIGQACVSIGVFIALALFLVPVAYLYDGKDSKKVAWVTSGVALLFAFNIVRMLFVSYEWLAYGPSEIIALVHATAGVFLFYAAMIVMVLAAGAYGLSLGAKAEPRRKRKRKGGADLWPISIALAIAFALAYACTTLSYSGAIVVSPLALVNGVAFNFSNAGIAHSVAGIVSGRGFNYSVVPGQDGTYVFFDLANRTINASEPAVLLAARPGLNITGGIESNSTVKGRFGFLNANGASEEVDDVVSNGTEFFLYHTAMPLALGDMSSSIADVYVILPGSVVRGSTCAASYNPIYAVALNAFNAESYNRPVRDGALKALCISDGIVWSQ